MGKNNRWMTWVLEESAGTTTAMPWANSAKDSARSRALADETDMQSMATMDVVYGKVAAIG
ncbi:MAG: hypothetical protein ABJN34_15620 [Litoreibacter sp.]|uniref:hypothetical protein n=1 Tax=Litoreibacter sp. TaxID=1969459 RepID=UPI00329A22E5